MEKRLALLELLLKTVLKMRQKLTICLRSLAI